MPTATKSKRKFEAEIDAPEGVSFEFKDNVLRVKGAKGETERRFELPNIRFLVSNDKVVVKAVKMTKREKALIGSVKAHINNMIKAVTEGIVYKLKVCSTHFPMNVAIQNNQLIVKNFIGERHPRVLDLPSDVDVKINGDIIEVHAYDKEKAGLTASRIEQLTRRVNFDNRVFQDGIYIIEKDGKEIK